MKILNVQRTISRSNPLPDATTVGPGPLDTVVELEQRRIRLGKKKQEICEVAGIKPEMMSYMLRRGRQGFDLPADCVAAVRRALTKLETRAAIAHSKQQEKRHV